MQLAARNDTSQRSGRLLGRPSNELGGSVDCPALIVQRHEESDSRGALERLLSDWLFSRPGSDVAVGHRSRMQPSVTGVETNTTAGCVSPSMGRVARFFVWAGTLHASYQVFLLGSILIGVLALLSGMMTENLVFVMIGIGWILVGPIVVWISERNE